MSEENQEGYDLFISYRSAKSGGLFIGVFWFSPASALF